MYSTAPPRLVGAKPSIRGPMVRIDAFIQRPFTSGTLGFLAGFSLAGVIGLYYLQREYRNASHSVLASSARLTHSAENVRCELTQVTGYLDRIHLVEQRMNQLESGTVSRNEIEEAAASFRKLYSDLFEETLELRKRMWELGTCFTDTEHETFATRKRHDAPSWAPPLEDRIRLPPVRII